MEGTLKVTPELLISAADDFSSKGQTISSLLNEMMNMVTALSSIWEGDAESAYVTKFKGLEDDIQLLLRMVNEHSTDLKEMAGEYNKAETESLDAINTLSSDVIV